MGEFKRGGLMINIIKSDMKFVESFNLLVGEVAKERKYLAAVEPFPLESTKILLTKIIDNDLSQFFAIKSDRVIGWCDILPKAFKGMDHVGILGMGVDKKYRNQGIGKRLLAKTLKHAKSKNLEKIELEVFEKNTTAIKFYEKHQFFREGMRLKSRKIDGKYDNILLMGLFF